MRGCFNKLFQENKHASELFLSDTFARSLIIMLEQQIKAREFRRVDDYEAFLESLEHWLLSQLSNLNNHKKREFDRAEQRLSQIAADSIFASVTKLSEEEKKQFILKN